MKHFVDQNGRYLGQFEDDGAPDGAIAVPTAPEDAAVQRWNGVNWVGLIRHYVNDADATYAGAFDGAAPPAGTTEVPSPPDHADYQIWDGAQWVDIVDREDLIADRDVTGIFGGSPRNRLIFMINLDQENRIRVLEGKPTITAAVYLAAIVARRRALP